VDPIFGTTAGGGGEDEGQSQIQRMRSSKFYEHFMQIADSVNAQRKLVRFLEN
jgi:hypothetical protein